MKGILKNIIEANISQINQQKLCIYGTKNTIDSIESIKINCDQGNCHGCETRNIESGPKGGDAQISALIVEGKIQLLIFLKNPFLSQSHYHEINALCRLAEMNNIAVAYNPRTARILLDQVNKLEETPNYDSHYNDLFKKLKEKTNDYQIPFNIVKPYDV